MTITDGSGAKKLGPGALPWSRSVLVSRECAKGSDAVFGVIIVFNGIMIGVECDMAPSEMTITDGSGAKKLGPGALPWSRSVLVSLRICRPKHPWTATKTLKDRLRNGDAHDDRGTFSRTSS